MRGGLGLSCFSDQPLPFSAGQCFPGLLAQTLSLIDEAIFERFGLLEAAPRFHDALLSTRERRERQPGVLITDKSQRAGR
ncbi:hypothetical protein UP09_27560 [Bradyrhizobium sp. LTSP885]|nr:hypothetical protein UP09_27560 [Bradyrhizobium sp. LTSP885]